MTHLNDDTKGVLPAVYGSGVLTQLRRSKMAWKKLHMRNFTGGFQRPPEKFLTPFNTTV